jgi:hypothetical protein
MGRLRFEYCEITHTITKEKKLLNEIEIQKTIKLLFDFFMLFIRCI